MKNKEFTLEEIFDTLRKKQCSISSKDKTITVDRFNNELGNNSYKMIDELILNHDWKLIVLKKESKITKSLLTIKQ